MDKCGVGSQQRKVTTLLDKKFSGCCWGKGEVSVKVGAVGIGVSVGVLVGGRSGNGFRV